VSVVVIADVLGAVQPERATAILRPSLVALDRARGDAEPLGFVVGRVLW
jgi:hypothetical protein